MHYFLMLLKYSTAISSGGVGAVLLCSCKALEMRTFCESRVLKMGFILNVQDSTHLR
jgi:hypothetical protein